MSNNQAGTVGTFKDLHVERIFVKTRKADGKFCTDGTESELTNVGSASVETPASTKSLELRFTTLENEVRLLKETLAKVGSAKEGPAGPRGEKGEKGDQGPAGIDGADAPPAKRFNVSIHDIAGIQLPEKLVNGTKLAWNATEEAFIPV
jgi:hypothetical protein